MNAPWWLWALAGTGAFALASVLVSLFTAIGRRPARLHLTDSPPLDSDDFLAALAGSINGTIEAGGSATVLANGDRFIPALLDDVDAARRSINFMVYIWEPGKMGDLFADALARSAESGVEVRVLLDGLGAFRMPDEHVGRMQDAGVHLERFRQPRFGRLTRFHKRNHRRAIIIDGRIGYTGGAAVGDKWLGDAHTPDHWRDDFVRVTGCMARDLQSAFAELWAHCCGELLVGDAFYANLDGDGAGEGGGRADGDGERDGVSDGNVRGDPVTAGRDGRTGTGDGCRSEPKHISLVSSPSSDEHPVRLFFNLTILAARERLWIATPYFVPDRGTQLNIIERARAGVDVRLLLPSEHTDARPIRWAAHGMYAELLEAGVRIWEYQPTMMHRKSIVVDGSWSVLGSANFDIRSKELNQENLLGVQDTALARQLEEMFLHDLEQSEEFTLERWKRRGMVARALEHAAAVFSEQY